MGKISAMTLGVALVLARPAAAQDADDPIAACDIPEIRFAMALDAPDWQLACDAGVIGAVRIDVDDEGETDGQLAWRSPRAEGRVSLRGLAPEVGSALMSDLIDLRFLPAMHGYRRLSLVTQEGEDHATRLEVQVWFRILDDGRWAIGFAGRVDGSVHINGICHHVWRARFERRGRTLVRRWRHRMRFDGPAADRADCHQSGRGWRSRRSRLNDVPLTPREEAD